MTRAALFAATVLVAVAAPRAFAQAPADATQQASALATAAAKLYAASDYRGAAAKFDDAYALDAVPSYLFNAAQAYRLGGVCDKAAARYEKFLAVAKDVQNLDKVRKYLDDERACAADHQLKAPPEPPHEDVKPPPPPPTAPVTPPLPPPVVVAEHPRRAWMRWTGIGLGVVGVGGIVLGVVEHGTVADAQAQHDACTAASPCTLATIHQIDDRGTSASHRMTAGFAVGGAALAGGALLYLLGRDPESASITPTRGGAVVSASLRF